MLPPGDAVSAGHRCSNCGHLNTPMPLLYPVKNKNYADNIFIRNEWNQLKNGFRNTFMIEARFINNNPIPKDLDFPELWQWYEQFKKAELK